MTIFKLSFPSAYDGRTVDNYYNDDEHSRMIACLRTVVESGRMAVITEGDYKHWKEQREEEEACNG